MSASRSAAQLVRAVIFDFDGLVLDTETPELRSWQEEFEAAGVTLDVARWMEGIGSGSFDPYRELGEATGSLVDRDAIRSRRRARYAELVAAETPLPGVIECITAAQHVGAAVAVASSSTSGWVRQHLDAIGLVDRFDVICGRDDVGGRTKPAPDVYLEVLRRLAVTAGEAVALEDTPNGVRAAKAAGLRCIYVPCGLTRDLCCSDADVTLGSLTEVDLNRHA